MHSQKWACIFFLIPQSNTGYNHRTSVRIVQLTSTSLAIQYNRQDVENGQSDDWTIL